MKIILERGSWCPVQVSFNWSEEISYNPGFHTFTFFGSSKPRSPYDHAYNEAKELDKYLKDFLDFDFYNEEGVDKVMFHPKQDCKIIFKP